MYNLGVNTNVTIEIKKLQLSTYLSQECSHFDSLNRSTHHFLLSHIMYNILVADTNLGYHTIQNSDKIRPVRMLVMIRDLFLIQWCIMLH